MVRSIEAAPASFSVDTELNVFVEGVEVDADVYVDHNGDSIVLGLQTPADGGDRASMGADLTPEEAMAVAERLSMTAAEMMDFEGVDDGE